MPVDAVQTWFQRVPCTLDRLALEDYGNYHRDPPCTHQGHHAIADPRKDSPDAEESKVEAQDGAFDQRHEQNIEHFNDVAVLLRSSARSTFESLDCGTPTMK